MGFFDDDSRDSNNIRIVGYGIVKSILDKGILLISLPGGDSIKCAPLLPKHLSIIPIVGQGVFVISAEHKTSLKKDQIINGYWIGPLISQNHKLPDELASSAKSILPEGNTKPTPNLDYKGEAKGLYPKKEDIVLQSKGSGDLVLKEKQTVLRIAKFKDENELIFNNRNIGYVQLKDEDNSKKSTVNVVANKINLISHDGSHTYNLTDREELITSETQKEIEERSQSIVYGERLVQFLSLVKDYVTGHVHPYHGLPSDPDLTKINLLKFDLETILNKNIKTN